MKDGVAGHSTELGAGKALITGAVLSVTLIVCDVVDELPQSSVAVQVLVTLYSCGHVPFVWLSLNVKETVASQASVAVGTSNDGVAGHSTKLGAGNSLMTGAVLSITLIICDVVEALPQSSVAVQVRVTLYICGHVPGVVTSPKVNETVASQASVAVGVVKTGMLGQKTVLGAGRVLRTGAVLSVTLIV